MIWLDGNHSVYLQTPIRLYDLTSLHNLHDESIENILKEMEMEWKTSRDLGRIRKIINDWILTNPRVKNLEGGTSKYYIYLHGLGSWISHIFQGINSGKFFTGTRLLNPRHINFFYIVPVCIGLKCLNYVDKPKWPEGTDQRRKDEIEKDIRKNLCYLLENWENYKQRYYIRTLFPVQMLFQDDFGKCETELFKNFINPTKSKWGSKFCYSYITLYMSHKLGLI